MSCARSALIGLATAVVMLLPVTAEAADPVGGRAPMSSGHLGASGSAGSLATSSANGSRDRTTIKFLNFRSIRAWDTRATIRGQVIRHDGTKSGAAAGVVVKLYRRVSGTARYHFLRRQLTPSSGFREFVFHFRSVANASYMVICMGNKQMGPSAGFTMIWVHRVFNAGVTDGSPRARFHGHVAPRYAHHVIYLQKRDCLRCNWHTVRHERTGRHGHFSFRIGAPRHGVWRWRVSTPPSTRYIASYSAVFTTRRS
jgi:hypothetical protein